MAQTQPTPSASEHTLTIENPKPRGNNVVDLQAERERRRGGSPRSYTPWEQEEDALDEERESAISEFDDISEEEAFIQQKNAALLYDAEQAASSAMAGAPRYAGLPRMPRVPPQPLPPKKKKRIGKISGAIMILIALTLDLALVIMLIAGLGLFAIGVDAMKAQCSDWGMVKNALTCTKLALGMTTAAAASMAGLVAVGPAIVIMMGIITNAVAIIIFAPWFFFLRVSPFSSAKKAASLLINALAEIVSAGILPSITLAVALTIYFTHLEDKEKYKKALEEYEKEKKEYTKKYARLLAQRKKYADFLRAQRQMEQQQFAEAA